MLISRLSLQATDADRNSVVTYTFSDPAVYTYVRPPGPSFALKNVNTVISHDKTDENEEPAGLCYI